MAASPTQRSLAALRKVGYIAAVVEKWNPHAKIRQDLFGFIDLVAVHPEGSMVPGVLGVQATSYSNVSSRVKKCQANDYLPIWLAALNRVEVHGWQKKGRFWECRIVEVARPANPLANAPLGPAPEKLG